MSHDSQSLNRWLAAACAPHLALDESRLGLFSDYLELLLSWNERFNLTAITEPREVYVKHFYDSLTPAFVHDFTRTRRLMDVGTGAGFPGIPLKIAFPHIRLTLLDSLKKRISFLAEVVARLKLSDVELIHGRAEEVGRHPQHRERYDVAISRAVARLNVLSEYCLPFVRTGGVFIAMKGAQAEQEKQEARAAIRRLGGGRIAEHRFDLPDEAGERTLYVIGKQAATPKAFPRKPGMPAKQPL